MRPDDYQRQDAERWTEAVQLRNAINEERERARSEAKARTAITGDDDAW